MISRRKFLNEALRKFAGASLAALVLASPPAEATPVPRFMLLDGPWEGIKISQFLSAANGWDTTGTAVHPFADNTTAIQNWINAVNQASAYAYGDGEGLLLSINSPLLFDLTAIDISGGPSYRPKGFYNITLFALGTWTGNSSRMSAGGQSMFTVTSNGLNKTVQDVQFNNFNLNGNLKASCCFLVQPPVGGTYASVRYDNSLITEFNYRGVADTTIDGSASGIINSFNTLVAGTGGTAGTYLNVPLTGGTGSGAFANITVAAGGVTTVLGITPGNGYTAADTLSAASGNIGGTTGFSIKVGSVVNLTPGQSLVLVNLSVERLEANITIPNRTTEGIYIGAGDAKIVACMVSYCYTGITSIGSSLRMDECHSYQGVSGVGNASSTSTSVSGTTLTIGGTVTGTIAVGAMVAGATAGVIPPGTYIISGSGTSWQLSQNLGTITSQNFFYGGGGSPSVRFSVGFINASVQNCYIDNGYLLLDNLVGAGSGGMINVGGGTIFTVANGVYTYNFFSINTNTLLGLFDVTVEGCFYRAVGAGAVTIANPVGQSGLSNVKTNFAQRINMRAERNSWLTVNEVSSHPIMVFAAANSTTSYSYNLTSSTPSSNTPSGTPTTPWGIDINGLDYAGFIQPNGSTAAPESYELLKGASVLTGSFVVGAAPATYVGTWRVTANMNTAL